MTHRITVLEPFAAAPLPAPLLQTMNQHLLTKVSFLTLALCEKATASFTHYPNQAAERRNNKSLLSELSSCNNFR